MMVCFSVSREARGIVPLPLPLSDARIRRQINLVMRAGASLPPLASRLREILTLQAGAA